MTARLLILGGTGDAAALAEAAVARFRGRLEVTSSLAGRTRDPRPLPGEVRFGGFGGADGLARHLEARAVDMLVDATHPFAAHISANARRACRRAGVPRLILRRPPWTPRDGDRWTDAGDALEAKARVRAFGRRTFLALGSGELAAFRGLGGVPLVVRVAEPPARPPIPGCEVVVGRGPFAEADERRLLRRHRIGLVVSRNSGGEAGYGKIAAARALGLPVVMIARPPAEPGEAVETVEEAVGWIAGRLGA